MTRLASITRRQSWTPNQPSKLRSRRVAAQQGPGGNDRRTARAIIIGKVGAVQTGAGRAVQIEDRDRCGTARIHRRGGVPAVVSPIVRKRGEEHNRRGKPNCDGTEPHPRSLRQPDVREPNGRRGNQFSEDLPLAAILTAECERSRCLHAEFGGAS